MRRQSSAFVGANITPMHVEHDVFALGSILENTVQDANLKSRENVSRTVFLACNKNAARIHGPHSRL
jgi:hypothetical protein